jgi:hypothetical protein
MVTAALAPQVHTPVAAEAAAAGAQQPALRQPSLQQGASGAVAWLGPAHWRAAAGRPQQPEPLAGPQVVHQQGAAAQHLPPQQQRPEAPEEEAAANISGATSDASTSAGDGNGGGSAAGASGSAGAEDAEGLERGGEEWVMARVDPGLGPGGWPHLLDATVYLRVDGLELSSDALSDATLGRTALVAHSFLEDWTDAAAQCTEGAARG